MFARVKKSGKYQYLQIVENRREGSKVKQHVIATVGRIDRLQAKGQVETLIRSLSRFSEKALLVLSGKSEDISSEVVTIGPALVFDRLWQELGISQIFQDMLRDRLFGFDVERAIFLTVLHRLFASGSDRSCERWRKGYKIRGTEELALHQLYRAMAFLGEPIEDQRDATAFAPRCIKDEVEERLFARNRHLFMSLDMVFFDTTSIFFYGAGGEELGRRGFSKDRRPDCSQMVVGVVVDNEGRPICSEMWPGDTTDVKTLLPVVTRIRNRFPTGSFCVVADRGMISQATLEQFDRDKIPYILGVRLRQSKEVREQVLTRAGRYQKIIRKGIKAKDPAPLWVKDVRVGDRRYILCLNPQQARKEALDRKAILRVLHDKLRYGPKQLVGNKGFRKYLKISKGSVRIDWKKVRKESRFDGKWVLMTNTNLPADHVALKYKELWRVEHVFRDMKTLLETRPVYHRLDETIRGHVFCSFLALVLRKELDKRLEQIGCHFEWAAVKQDLKALKETIIEESGKKLAIRSQAQGTCGQVFKAVGVAFPPTIREV